MELHNIWTTILELIVNVSYESARMWNEMLRS
jgi:hypothetical protein